jgi:hypothetical protein
MGSGNYCNNCGQPYIAKRISLPGLLHDVFHFFTHFEKGLGYTLKQLALEPGTMQRLYIEGIRGKYQKPFSMFIICASVNGVARYWILRILSTQYHKNTLTEAIFFHEYELLLFPVLMPLFTLITWLFFRKSKYNYAETGVMQLYNFSIFLLAAIPITMLRFIWPDMDTAFVEFPVYTIYFADSAENGRYCDSAYQKELIRGLILPLVCLQRCFREANHIVLPTGIHPWQIILSAIQFICVCLYCVCHSFHHCITIDQVEFINILRFV